MYLSFENVNVAVFFLQLTINDILVVIKSEEVAPNFQEIPSPIPVVTPNLLKGDVKVKRQKCKKVKSAPRALVIIFCTPMAVAEIVATDLCGSRSHL